MWELDCEEGWAPKNWCFWTVVLEKTLESPLDCKEIQPVHPKDINPEYSLEGLVLNLKLQKLQPPDAKSWFIRKDPDAGKDWGQQKGMTENEMVEWHHWLSGQEFEQALGDGEGQGSLACCSPWCRKESDPTERMGRTDISKWFFKKSEPSRKTGIKQGQRFHWQVKKFAFKHMNTCLLFVIDFKIQFKTVMNCHFLFICWARIIKLDEE